MIIPLLYYFLWSGENQQLIISQIILEAVKRIDNW